MNPIRKLFSSVKGATDVVSTVIDSVMVLALIPTIVFFISQAENITATEKLLLSLITLFLVLGLIVSIGKRTGLIKGKA